MKKAEMSSAANGRSGQFDLEEKAMSEEGNNAEMSDARDAAEETKKLSEDARGLGPGQAGRIRIGVVDMIVGEGGLEMPGLVTTKNETLQLVRYWANEIVGLDFTFFLYGCVGSSDWRIREYACRRLDTIAKSIGEEEVKKVFAQAEQDFGKGVDQRAWKIFMEGTKEEQERFQDEVMENLAGDAVSASDKHTPPEHTGGSNSWQALQRAYQMYEQGSTHFAVMSETGLDRETAEWISKRQSAGLGYFQRQSR
jgi:hypothetical protein